MTNNHVGSDAPEEAALVGAKVVEPCMVACDACPVLCRIRPGRTGACDRYGNVEARLTRANLLTLAARSRELARLAGDDGSGNPIEAKDLFVTVVRAGTTYPDYKPATFIIASEIDGGDMITVVSEGVFSYCGLEVKIDTDRHLGPETTAVRAGGEAVGHVAAVEYGSQMLSLGGAHHLAGSGEKAGVITCDTILCPASGQVVELTIDRGARVVVRSGRAPIVADVAEPRMRIGCGAATTGIFANQWLEHADEVIVVDNHITGGLNDHQTGQFPDMRPAGIRVRGRRSTPGRDFHLAGPGTHRGGTDIEDPLATIIGNAVGLLGHPAIDRRAANPIDLDNDPGDRLITHDVGPPSDDAIEAALDAGVMSADISRRDGLIEGAVLAPGGRPRTRHPSPKLLESA